MPSDFPLKWNLNLPNSQTQSVEGGSQGQRRGGWEDGNEVRQRVQTSSREKDASQGLVCSVVMMFTLCHTLKAAGRVLWVFFPVSRSNTTEYTGGHPTHSSMDERVPTPAWLEGAQLLHCGRKRTAGSESGLPFPQSAKELLHPLVPWRPCRSLAHSHPAIMGSTPPMLAGVTGSSPPQVSVEVKQGTRLISSRGDEVTSPSHNVEKCQRTSAEQRLRQDPVQHHTHVQISTKNHS